MPVLVKAIVSGFGYKLGMELARYVSDRVGLSGPRKKPEFKKAVEGGEDPTAEP